MLVEYLILLKLLDKKTKSGTLILLHPLCYYHTDKLDCIDPIKAPRHKL